jgi:hypothetical protein
MFMAATEIDLSAIRPDTLYPAEAASRFLNRNTKTLANDRCQRRGCAVTYVGKSPYYKGSDIIADLEGGRVDFRQPEPSRNRGKVAA